MTIRDLMEQGIRIQGAFQIKEWNEEESTYIMLSEGSQFEYESCDIDDDVLDMEIKYLYAIPTAESGAWTVFEVAKEY
jgi:hypothetical protein